MIRLLLVRHGESEWNVAGRVQGQAAGVRLTPRGREQADAVARELAGCGAALLVSSDLERALETAAIIGNALGLPVVRAAELREQALGDMEGRLGSELTAEPTPPGQHLHEVRWGGGESVADVYARVSGWLSRLRASADGQTVVAVTHAGPMQVLRTIHAGGGHRDVDWTPVPPAGILDYTWD